LFFKHRTQSKELGRKKKNCGVAANKQLLLSEFLVLCSVFIAFLLCLLDLKLFKNKKLQHAKKSH